MINKYIPTEIYFDGTTYFEGVQNVPEIVADFIDNHPQLSKIQQPKPVDKFTHLKSLSLSELEALLKVEYQEPLERIEHQLNIKRQMGATESELRKQIQNLDRLKIEYQEVLDYVEPIISAKKADEQKLAKSLQSWAGEFGGQVSVTSTGYPAIHVPRQTVTVSRGAK